MNADILNHIDMLRLVLLIFSRPDAVAIIENTPALKAAYLKYAGAMDEIEQVSVKLASVTEGITEEKTLVRSILEAKTLIVSRVLVAYAHSINDLSLMRDVYYAKSSLEALRDNRLLSVTRLICERGNSNAGIFADYGLGAECLTELQTAIDNFDVKDKEPREAIDVQKTLNQKAADLVSVNCKLLKFEIDNMMLVLPAVQADLVQTYFNARIIIDLHGKYRKDEPVTGFGTLYGNVTSSIDNSAIENALIVLVGTEFSATTDESGDYLMENVPAGLYDAEVTAETYVKKNIAGVEIQPDGETELDSELDPSV
jgi:hypothetical protein